LNFQEEMARPKRFELLTPSFVVWCFISMTHGGAALPPIVWIDLMTGTTCAPDPIENGGQVIQFIAPSSGLRGKDKAKDKQIAKQKAPSPTK
jgi:hypothetical protein